MTQPLSANGPIKLAMTVDDLFQWKGLPFPEGYTPHSISKSMIEAFDRHDVPPVYAFSATAPVDDDRDLLSVYDAWCEAGHHVGNHTHYHASLNWVEPATYIQDIERTEELIDQWIDKAPTKYFRYCMDMWGDTAAKTAEVQSYLAGAGYMPAPVSTWFYDAQMMVPYWRTIVSNDSEARRWLQDKAIEVAVSQLRSQTKAAREAHGRDPIHIGLMHGTPIMGDTADRVLEAYQELGVEFVTLEEAMRDPANSIQPPITKRQFRNFTQKWAEVAGVEVEDTPPREALAEIRAVAPVEGMTEEEVLGNMFTIMSEALGGAEPNPDDFDWH